MKQESIARTRVFPRLLQQTVIAGVIVFLSPYQLLAQGYVAIRDARIETVAGAGTIDRGTILIRDGKIEQVGTDVEIPLSAHVMDASGKTITPGFVDPYFVVSIGRNVSATPTRTITFRGRTFVISGGTPAIATTFARVADALKPTEVNWDAGRRSGITTYHVVTGGFAQSLTAQLTAQAAEIEDPDGQLLVTLTNSTKSLDVLRGGLKAPAKQSGNSSRPSAASRRAASQERSDEASPARATGAPAWSGRSSSAGSGPVNALWDAVREGKSPVFVNVNNAAAILHAHGILKEHPKANVALVASGQDVYRTIEQLARAKSYTLVLPPRIDLVPNSRNRMNVPKLWSDKKKRFAFSLSLGQSDFSAQPDTPLFGVAMLVRGGLDKDIALRALTLVPAEMLGIEKEVGSIEAGKKANLVMFSGDPFAATTGIDQVLIDGRPVYEN